MNKTISKPIYTPIYSIDIFLPENRSMLYDYCCTLCGGVFEDPVLDACGQIYCNKCVTNYCKEYGMCPNNNKCDPTKFTHMKFIIQIIEKQKLYCKNKKLGCNWSDMYVKLGGHLSEECKFQPVKCVNEGCDVELSKSSIELHMAKCEYRNMCCQYCDEVIKVNENEKHYEICPKILVNCPQYCGESLERRNLENHTNEFCKNIPVYCPYKKVGCLFNSTKGELYEHIKDNTDKHNFLILDEITDLKEKITKLSDSLEQKVVKLFNLLDSRHCEMVLKTGEDSKGNSNHSNNSNNIIIKNETNKNKAIEESLTKESENSKTNLKEMMNKKRIREEINLVENIDSEGNDSDHKSLINPLISLKASNENQNRYYPSSNIKLPPQQSNDRSSNGANISESITYNFNSKHSIYQEEITFDTLDISKGINVNVNVATCSINSVKQEHRFAMVNNILNDSKCEWKITLNKLTNKWIGVGVCLKELVISNKFKFVANKTNFMHGTFMISTNGYLWNTNNEDQNNKQIPNFPHVKSGDEIGFKFDFEKELLEILIGTFRIELTEVTYPKGNYLVPCVVFLFPGDEVTFSKLNKF